MNEVDARNARMVERVQAAQAAAVNRGLAERRSWEIERRREMDRQRHAAKVKAENGAEHEARLADVRAAAEDAGIEIDIVDI